MTKRGGQYARLVEAAQLAADSLDQTKDGLQGRIDRLLERLEAKPDYLLSQVVLEPRSVILEMTLRCNMRCRHCGSTAGRPRPQELDLGEWLALCDDLVELGARQITLLGGEPLLSPHWQKVAKRLTQAGAWVNTITNGWTLSDPNVADQIAESGLRSVGLSIDGNRASHDELRRRPGSFDHIDRGIELLTERGYESLSAVTCVTRANLPELPWLHEYLTSRSVRRWRLQICVPEGRMSRKDPVVLRPSDLPKLVDQIRLLRDRSGLRVSVADNVGYFGGCEDVTRYRHGKQRFWTGCSAGLQTLGITSDGGVLGCLSFPAEKPWLEGNIRHRPMAEIWNDEKAFAYNRQFSVDQLSGPCRGCRYGLLCRGGCLSANIGYCGHIGENPYCLELVGQRGQESEEDPSDGTDGPSCKQAL